MHLPLERETHDEPSLINEVIELSTSGNFSSEQRMILPLTNS